MKELVLFDKTQNSILGNVRSDGDMLSLTDLWKTARSPKSKSPNDWLRLDSSQQLIDTVAEILNTVSSRIIKTKKGKGGGSYAHRNVALAYAKYLDPKLHAMVNEIFFQRIEEEKNPDLIGKRYIETYIKKGKSKEWISQRLKSIDSRNGFTKTLYAHGVTGEGFRNCTNAIYEPLYGGTAAVVREKKGLAKGQSVRDSMSRVELAAVGLAEALASDEIEKKEIRGNGNCEVASRRASRSVANALMEHKKYIL